ncbi:MAG: hypothetical protein ACHQQ3_07560 [Gemmatimonadales bacterium]
MSSVFRAAFAAAVLVPAVAAAPPPPCSLASCRVIFDWGGGQTAANFPQDQRYGSGDDFESRVRSSFIGKGLHLADAAQSGQVLITLRPRVKSAMCNAMPGTNTDMSCQMIGDLTIVFSGGEPGTKPPGSRNLRNSCGDASMLMTMSQFGQYTGEMLAFFLDGEKKGEKRPSLKC